MSRCGASPSCHVSGPPRCEWAAATLTAGTSFLTSIQFYDTFLSPVIADPAYDSIITWWKAAT